MTPSWLMILALAEPTTAAASAVSEPTAGATGYTHLAPVPCPDGPEGPDWRVVEAAHRTAQLDTLGLPSGTTWMGRAGLFRSMGAAVDAVCARRAPTTAEVDAARHALGGEAPAALGDALRGLLALAFERAGRTDDARPLWAEVRAGDRPSGWLVRALLAGADARAAGDLAFSARQQFQRAFELGDPGARCYAAWRLAEETARPAGPDEAPDSATIEAARAQARSAAEAETPVCMWVRARLPASPPTKATP
jgi:hypothetical protein